LIFNDFRIPAAQIVRYWLYINATPDSQSVWFQAASPEILAGFESRSLLQHLFCYDDLLYLARSLVYLRDFGVPE
jgi:hypothetical protein